MVNSNSRRITVFPRNRMPSSESRTEPYISQLWTSEGRGTGLPHKSLHSAGAAVNLLEGHFPEHLAAVLSVENRLTKFEARLKIVLLQLLDLLDLAGNLGGESFLEALQRLAMAKAN
jgi:hypothetical protein